MHKYASRLIYNVNHVFKRSPSSSTYLPPNAFRLNGWWRRVYATEAPALGNTDQPFYDEGDSSISELPSNPPNLVEETARLPESKQRGDPEAWLALLKTYLPVELRSGRENSSPEPLALHGVQPIHTLPALLAASRSTAPLKVDPLTYLGSHDGRWDSVIWLVKALIVESSVRLNLNDLVKQTQYPPWESGLEQHSTLDELTGGSIRLNEVDLSKTNGESLDHLTNKSLSVPSPPGHRGLGQVWASVASMILEATDLPADDNEHKATMSHALEIIAHLHHVDALPRTIYTYSPSEDPSVICKPPTLYLLAYRIMTVLSDSAWKAYDEDVRKEGHSIGANTSYKGHELPGPPLQPRINGLGSEIWIELVLWCCIEAGYISEAAWVVTEMAKRRGSQRWKVIDWHSISEKAESKLNWSATIELEITRSRMNQIGSGIGIAGHSGAPPLVQMGPRTISREVILALMDALGNAFDPCMDGQSASNVPAMTTRYMNACKTLLGRSAHGLEDSLMNKSILNTVESGMVDQKNTPRELEQILAMSPAYRAKTESQGFLEDANSPLQIYEADYSTACIGLLHKALYAFSRQSNLQGALRMFQKLQSLVDTNHRRHIAEFTEEVQRKHSSDEHDGGNMITDSIYDMIPSVHSELPVYVLASLLDLVTQAGSYEFGDWLLFSNDVDGPLIPPSLYSEGALEPALLRFAEATANGELFARISDNLQPPLPRNILRTLLHCQIALGKWDAAEDVFRHFQSEGHEAIKAKDIMAVARALLREERHSPGLDPSQHRGYALLQDLLRGKLNPPRSLFTVRDYSDYRLLTQIGRILNSLPGSLGQMPAHTFSGSGRANAPIVVPTKAFNTLLEGVVEAYGSLAARKVWTQWCLPLEELRRVEPGQAPRHLGEEHVVTPSLQTLRVLMRPMVKAGKICNREEAELVAWAIEAARSLGLNAKEIYHELSGLVHRPKSPDEQLVVKVASAEE
ncbi:MAG: hypothetical protein Q9191_002885 [Dirinaria sp. TL-2023a]